MHESVNIMQLKANGVFVDEDTWTGDEWSTKDLYAYVQARLGVCVVVISGYAIDVTSYQGEHVGHKSTLLISRSNSQVSCSPEVHSY